MAHTLREHDHTSYPAWVDRLGKALLITNDGWLTSLRGEWRNAFEARGLNLADLHDAIDAMLLDDELPNTGRDLYQTICKHAGASQRVRISKSQRAAPSHEFGICETCGNSGYAIVPQLSVTFPDGTSQKLVDEADWYPVRHNAHGDPIHATYAVSCRCAIGKRSHDAAPGDKKPMSLDMYEGWNPYWRVQMARRDEGRRAECDARADGRPLRDPRGFAASVPSARSQESRKAASRSEDFTRKVRDGEI